MDFDADGPISALDQDEFSFGEFAQGLAKELIDYRRPRSFVIGIDGPWGSGKTSLLNLVRSSIEQYTSKFDQAERPLILPFSPWIVGNREALLREFLPLLARELRQQIPWRERPEKARRAIRTLAQYGRAVRGVELGLGVALATATLFSIPISPFFAPFLGPLAGMFASLGAFFNHAGSKQLTLDELRSETQRALEGTTIRAIVVLDDLDRLEPEEILGVCRLVRSTVDLPHIAFLVAYDRAKTAEYIKGLLSVDGEEYLEKIIQLPLNAPPVSPTDLARVMAERLQVIFPNMNERQSTRASKMLWQNIRPAFLKSARDIGRITNQVTFAWSMMRKEADPSDIILISALRSKAPNLFRWCRDYCDAYYNQRATTFDRKSLVEKFKASLSRACASDNVSEDYVLDSFSESLPGVGGFMAATNNLFGDITGDDSQENLQEKRLASEQRWQSYFDLTPGRYGFTDSWYAEFLANAQSNPRKAEQDFIALAGKQRTTGGTLGDYLIDRVRADLRANRFSEELSAAIFTALINSADSADIAAGPSGGFFTLDLKFSIEWACSELLRALAPTSRLNQFIQAINTGKSLSIVMSLLRAELRRHGRIAGQDSSDREEKKIFSAANDVDRVCSVANERLIRAGNDGTLLYIYDLAIPLLAWRDVGQRERMRSWVESETKEDEKLLDFLMALKQQVISSAGNYWKISRSLLAEFADTETIKRRLEQLTSSTLGATSTKAIEALKLIRNDEAD